MIDAYGWIAQLRTSRGLMQVPLAPVTLTEYDNRTEACAVEREVTFHVPSTRTATAFEIRIPFAGGHNVALYCPTLPMKSGRGETFTVSLPRPLVTLENAV